MDRRRGTQDDGEGESRRADRGADRLERLRRSNRDWSRKQAHKPAPGGWMRQSWTLPRAEARDKAREFLKAYPQAAYGSEVESWRVLPGDIIEFTMRRLPSAD